MDEADLSKAQQTYLGKCICALFKKDQVTKQKIKVIMTLIRLDDEAKETMFAISVNDIATKSQVSNLIISDTIKDMEMLNLLIVKRNKGRTPNCYVLNT